MRAMLHQSEECVTLFKLPFPRDRVKELPVHQSFARLKSLTPVQSLLSFQPIQQLHSSEAVLYTFSPFLWLPITRTP
uniref:Uncharacterized protein n=1 Tax=Anguilla anguilla TaxID=7936 RepID=A0A0E9U7L8_ANGAN